MVLDTNVLILFSKGDGVTVDAVLRVREPLSISRMTYIEFLADPRLNGEEMEEAKRFLTGSFSIIDVTEELADIAIEIRKQRFLKLPDAIIVATAILLDQKLFTRDVRIRKAFPKITISP